MERLLELLSTDPVLEHCAKREFEKLGLPDSKGYNGLGSLDSRTSLISGRLLVHAAAGVCERVPK